MKRLTFKEIGELMNMHPNSIAKYANGSYEPRLIATIEIVNGHTKTFVNRTDFEAWKAEYEKKPPFGSRLHAVRRKGGRFEDMTFEQQVRALVEEDGIDEEKARLIVEAASK